MSAKLGWDKMNRRGKSIVRGILKATSLALIVGTDAAIKEGNRRKATLMTVAGAGLNVIDFCDTLKTIADKKFDDIQIQEKKDDWYYFTTVVKKLTIGPIINSFLIASSIRSISKMK